jgi:murein DD-endopeptidase MepM/ murein hydrolase activator NlpD
MSDIPAIAGIDLPKSIDVRQVSDPAREHDQVKTLAQEFEAMLMLQMIREMRRSMLDETESDQGLGGETMRDTFDIELAGHLARAGGFGLGTMLAKQLEVSTAPVAAGEGNAQEPGSEAIPLATTHEFADVSTSRQSSQIQSRPSDTETDSFRLSMPVEGATTSPFGWRADPMNGRSRFHQGVDLRAAYGTEVPAADAGEVVFAGERGAYGNLVIVRHDNGVETRYAHLASIAVSPGATVAAGDPLGRVGSTGRSTAPHLHFEVLVNGERVDPERVAARVGRGPLKFVSHADD